MTGLNRFQILGPLTVTRDGEQVRLGGPKERLILATLLASESRVVPVDRLVDVLWDEEPPARATAALQVHVSHTRRRLGEGRPTIVTRPPGYAVPVTAETLDLLRFQELTAQARALLADGDLVAGAELLARADGLWRGQALADLDGSPFVVATRQALEEQRAAAGEARVAALSGSGRSEDALTVIARLLDAFPLRETLWQARMLALYRLGRQAEALAAYRDCRERLMDELGVEPTAAVRTLHRAILEQDPALDRPPHVDVVDVEAVARDLPATFVVGTSVAELVLGGDGADEVFPLARVVTIGRDPSCDVALRDVSVSRRHAEIRPALGGHLLIDLASSNGTRVAGESVVQRLLANGDVIEIGPYTLTYRHVAPSPSGR